jgi:putative restriction endonuclease
VLVQTYSIPGIQLQVAGMGFFNLATNAHARDVIAGVKDGMECFARAPPEQKKPRDQGFWTTSVSLFGQCCALCSLRKQVTEGHTVVEAAHIVPWSESLAGLPANGLGLCRLCHWSFDEGLMGVDAQYEVLVSDRVRIDSNMPGHVLTLAQQPIFKPHAERFWPGQSNLERHRKTCFT